MERSAKASDGEELCRVFSFLRQLGKLLAKMTPDKQIPRLAAPSDARQAEHKALKESLKGQWLVRIRWASLCAYALVASLAVLLLDIRSDLPILCGLIAIGAASNLGFSTLLRREPKRAAMMSGVAISLDVLLLAALLYLYGGYTNPFSMVFLVYVTLAAFFLNSRWTWWIFLLSSAAFVALFFLHVPLEQLSMGEGHAGMDHAAMMGGHEGPQGFSLHLHGMLVAFLVIGLITAIFLGRLSRELEEQSERLEAMVERDRESRQLMALASLTAGAAHELATPLGTLTLIAEELRRELGESEQWREDLDVMRGELARCEQVLNRMRAQSSELAGEAPSRITVGAVLRAVQREMRPGEEITVEPGEAEQEVLYTLGASLVSSLSALARNAVQASSGKAPVTVNARMLSNSVEFLVQDRGAGMTAEILRRAGDPFFTTKSAGQGLGLGVFLVKLFASQVGGAFSLQSAVGQGSEARLLVPREVSV